jgi:hypothetical protein
MCLLIARLARLVLAGVPACHWLTDGVLQLAHRVLEQIHELELEAMGLEEALHAQVQATREYNVQLARIPHILEMVFDIELPSSPDGACYINGFRFGPLLSQWVKESATSWDEVNSAWGEVALLLYTLANLSGISLGEYARHLHHLCHNACLLVGCTCMIVVLACL